MKLIDNQIAHALLLPARTLKKANTQVTNAFDS